MTETIPVFRSVIVEDEIHSQQVLQNYLHRYCPETEVVGTADSVERAVDVIRRQSPDLVFLDIRLKRGLGFEVLEQLGDFNFDVVYTTAHREYAVQAMNIAGAYYILKPVGIDDLRKAIAKLKRGREQQAAHSNAASGQGMATPNFHFEQLQTQKIPLPTSVGREFVPMGQIIRCEAAEQFTNFYFVGASRPKMYYGRIGHYHRLLTEQFGFFRTHRSHLINVRHMIRYTHGKSGSFRMLDDHEVPLTSKRRKVFISRFPGLL